MIQLLEFILDTNQDSFRLGNKHIIVIKKLCWMTTEQILT